MRILVAEDNDASRHLVIELLAVRGHIVVAAADGRQALAAFEKGDFDLILVDQEMPLMDGLAVAREIRRIERASGKHAAIVGLSGNATAEDERTCLEAGMDGFLAKPFDRKGLYRAIGAVVDSAKPLAPASPAEDSADTASHLRSVTGGSQKLQRALIRTFLADAPEKLSRIQRAIRQRESEKLASTAHSLKGALGIFHATNAVAAARNLEIMGRTQDLEGALSEFGRLETELDALLRELRWLQQNSNSPPAARPRSK